MFVNQVCSGSAVAPAARLLDGNKEDLMTVNASFPKDAITARCFLQ